MLVTNKPTRHLYALQVRRGVNLWHIQEYIGSQDKFAALWSQTEIHRGPSERDKLPAALLGVRRSARPRTDMMRRSGAATNPSTDDVHVNIAYESDPSEEPDAANRSECTHTSEALNIRVAGCSRGPAGAPVRGDLRPWRSESVVVPSF